MSFREWMDKQTVIYPYSGYYSAINGHELSSHETYMNIKCTLLNKISQYERLYIVYHSSYMTFKKSHNYRGGKKISGLEVRGGSNKWSTGNFFFEPCSYFVWYHNGGYMTLCLSKLKELYSKKITVIYANLCQ